MKNWLLSMKVAIVCSAIVLASSCGQGSAGLPKINGVDGPSFNLLNGQIIMTIKFLNLELDGGAEIPVPETRNSKLALMPNVMDGGMMLTLTIARQDLEDLNIGIGDGNTLPDGRPLPGIPGGKLENSLRIDTEIGNQDVSFYYHETLFGLWMPFGFDTAGISGYWNVNINSKNVGFLGIVGNDQVNGFKAGGVVLLRLKNLKTRQLKRLLDLSERNPHFVY